MTDIIFPKVVCSPNELMALAECYGMQEEFLCIRLKSSVCLTHNQYVTFRSKISLSLNGKATMSYWVISNNPHTTTKIAFDPNLRDKWILAIFADHNTTLGIQIHNLPKLLKHQNHIIPIPPFVSTRMEKLVYLRAIALKHALQSWYSHIPKYRRLKQVRLITNPDEKRFTISKWCYGSYTYHTPWFDIHIQYY